MHALRFGIQALGRCLLAMGAMYFCNIINQNCPSGIHLHMINKITSYLRNSGEFPKRIKHRHDTFWKDPNAEVVRNTKMFEHDRLENWKDAPYWQRKLSNKSNAREFALMHGCRLPDLYWRGRDIDSVDMHALPPNYVIRPTVGHCSSLVFLMKEGFNLFDREVYTPEQIKNILKKELTENPKLEFLFEEFLEHEEGEHNILDDYKFFCFNGEIACIWVINRLGPRKGFSSFYDENWQRLEEINYIYTPTGDQPAPACLNDMIKSAKKLSKAYGIFVRIDFYATYKGCVFGEFTPTPSMGRDYSKFGQKLLLSYWDTYCKGLI
ncbi:hypothetical protein FFF34_010245 [Inquilinus sp. KBS0705]|nr:hypothetical protein FFF34_010245 [Inquilinus sp. KBS0705]